MLFGSKIFKVWCVQAAVMGPQRGARVRPADGQAIMQLEEALAAMAAADHQARNVGPQAGTSYDSASVFALPSNPSSCLHLSQPNFF